MNQQRKQASAKQTPEQNTQSSKQVNAMPTNAVWDAQRSPAIGNAQAQQQMQESQKDGLGPLSGEPYTWNPLESNAILPWYMDNQNTEKDPPGVTPQVEEVSPKENTEKAPEDIPKFQGLPTSFLDYVPSFKEVGEDDFLSHTTVNFEERGFFDGFLLKS